MRKQTRKETQPGNGKNPGKRKVMHGNDILKIELTRDEIQLLWNIMNDENLALKKPVWKLAGTLDDKLGEALREQ